MIESAKIPKQMLELTRKLAVQLVVRICTKTETALADEKQIKIVAMK